MEFVQIISIFITQSQLLHSMALEIHILYFLLTLNKCGKHRVSPSTHDRSTWNGAGSDIRGAGLRRIQLAG